VKIWIDQPRGKENLVQAFKQVGCEIANEKVGELFDSSVKLIIPTVDETLPFFARSKDYLLKQGIRAMVGSPFTIDMCRDKAEFFRFCRRHGFDTPETAQGHYMLKPRFGKGGRGNVKIDRSFILQEFIDLPEFSIDYFADWDGTCLSCIPRLRVNVVNGESQKATFGKHEFIVEVCKKLAGELHLVGHNVIQGFYDGTRFLFTEVNPRFGGGSHLTFHLFNSPKWLRDNM
jgi:carbamoyl-phosphate synthase large subunit